MTPSLFDQAAPAIALRDYQQAALDAIVSFHASGGRRGLVAMATGLGKTLLFAHLPKTFGRMLVVAHREELLDQAAAKIAAANPTLFVGIEQAGRIAPRGSAVVVASIQTLASQHGRRLEAMGMDFGVVVVDEAHHSAARTYTEALAHFSLAPDVRDLREAIQSARGGGEDEGDGGDGGDGGDSAVRRIRAEFRKRYRDFRPSREAPLLVGFTATPNRSDGTGLESLYDEIVYSMDIQAGMEGGWLCPIRGRRITTGESLDGVRVTAGDFAERELAEAVNTPERNALVVAAYQEHAAGRQALVFCVDVAHTEDMLDAFTSAGVSAGMVTGATDHRERAATIRGYKAGDLLVLCNCMVLTEGFDAPETSCILMARPTKSSLLYTQMLGRGTRLSERDSNKDLLVLDMVDIARKAGVANLNTLFGLPPKLDAPGLDILAVKALVDPLSESLSEDMVGGMESIEAMQQAFEEFDPLRRAVLPDWFAGYTRLAWIKTSYGFALPVVGIGQLGIVLDKLDRAQLRLKVPGAPTAMLGSYDGATTAVREADAWVGQYALEHVGAENLLHVLSRDARWRGDSASDKQKALLVKLGVRFNEGVSKGDAGVLIGQALERRHARGDRWRR
ncbi:MAG: DEAD/DEAH box helicase [Dehalococcoidia bacterium]|nr:DEAD/DEAH box helicase [Dehalococcoidia bacterium]